MLKKKLKNFFALERNIAVVVIANLFWSTITLYNGFLPKFYESLGASIFFIGLIYSLNDMSYSFSSFIGGHLGDAYGRKNIFVRTSFISNFLLLAYVFAPNWIFLVPFILFGSLVNGLGDASAHTLISESVSRKRRATALASINLVAIILSTILTPIGAMLVQTYGMTEGVRIGVSISFFFSLLGTIILFRHVKETYKKVRKKIKFNFNFSDLKKFFKKLPVGIKGIFLYASLIYFTSSIVKPYWIFYALDVIKISFFQFGIWEGVQFISVAFFMFLGAKLSDKYGRKKILLFSTVVSSLIPFLFVFSTNFFQLLLLNVVIGVGTLGVFTLFPYVADSIDPKRRSKAIGITNGLMALVGIPGPFIGSLFYIIMPQYPFILSGLLTVVAFIVGVRFLK